MFHYLSNPNISTTIVSGKVSVRERDERKEWSVLADKILTFEEKDVDDLAEMLRDEMWYEDFTDNKQESSAVETSGLSIVVPDRPSHEMISQLREIFLANPGHDQVYLVVNSGGEQRKVSTEYSVQKTSEVMGQVGAIVGEGNVY